MPPQRPPPCLHCAVVAAMACVALLACSCWGNDKNRYQHKKSYAQHLRPAKVRQRGPRRHTQVRTLRVRAYTDRFNERLK